jgi:hypothetical protein
MPIVIPTPDEIDAMSWRARQAWQKRMLDVLSQAYRSALHIGAAEMDVNDARAWIAYYGLDPDWRKHQENLLEAIS